ncbi:MAG: heme o synthase [Candidatus Neomarinimicrobiota bacterium]
MGRVVTGPHRLTLRGFSKFASFSTLILLFAGGLVTSTGSGLAVPDWPNTYGHFMFTFPPSKMVGGILYEHAHRLIASIVGLLILILAVWLWRSEPRPWVKKLGVVALLTVIAQGILGGVTVLFLLPTAVSVAHGVLAQTFFCLTIAIAYFMSREWQTGTESSDTPYRKRLLRWSAISATLIFVQLILGAVMRHTGSGLAILDFPLAGGRVIPPFNGDFLNSVNAARFELGLDPVTLYQVVLHFVHRVGAVMVMSGIAGTSFLVFRHERTNRNVLLLTLCFDSLLIVQLLLAGFVIWTAKSPLVTTFHVWVGALMLGTSVLMSLKSYRLVHGSQPLRVRGVLSRISSLWELTKPRITGLVLVATFLGFYLAAGESGQSVLENRWLLLHLLFGSALASGGVGVLNEFLEWKYDSLMHRTRSRPIPSGNVTPATALLFGVIISLVGTVHLAVFVNLATAGLAFATLLLYLFVYTPLKRKTVWNTLIGAIPGALPPIGGWLAVGEQVSPAAWILFGILLLWQIPHFFSIARIYRKDYRRAGFKMLPVVDERGTVTFLYVVACCAALTLWSLMLSLAGPAGKTYFYGAAILGIAFLLVGVDAALRRKNSTVKRLLLASVLYLPALLAILFMDRTLFG